MSLNSIPEPYRLSSYDFDLPKELIAQHPSDGRSDSRLLVMRKRAREIEHRVFADLPDLLSPDDLLVINETRVTPALLIGRKPSGGRVELLVLDPATANQDHGSIHQALRVCMVKSSKPLKPGSEVVLDGGPPITAVNVVGPGRVQVRFPVPETGFPAFLDAHGRVPLPPYIRPEDRFQGHHRTRYQTVYARTPGSVAAPTAGLHFTEELLDKLTHRGIDIARIVLHVGPGTFSPVRDENVLLHKMESERYEVPEHADRLIREARNDKRRIIAVGTTSVRTLESAYKDETAHLAGHTNLFITPGYDFKITNGLITNFHLPRSTLLMLVCAFAGMELVMSAYHEAVRLTYRFYSYGDASLILD
ncbi:MAG: tRNA preQ1(34) S-adenosylmethionine ribosyltransferase-isomerase QueA [Pseudomonadota bacterium]